VGGPSLVSELFGSVAGQARQPTNLYETAVTGEEPFQVVRSDPQRGEEFYD